MPCREWPDRFVCASKSQSGLVNLAAERGAEILHEVAKRKIQFAGFPIYMILDFGDYWLLA